MKSKSQDSLEYIKKWKKPIFTVVKSGEKHIRFPLQRNQLIRMIEEDPSLTVEIRTTCHSFGDYGKSLYVYLS